MKSQVWLITGVSKGLGSRLAKQALDKGNIVIGTVRTEEDKRVFEKNTSAKAFIIDLSNTSQIPIMVDAIIKEYGIIDVLVNNAGYGAFGMIEEFEEAEILSQFQINVFSVWKLCQAVLPHMRQEGDGTIVQISSRVGITAGVGNGIYASSKFALEGMSEALKLEVEPFGIKVLLVEPGALRTDFFGASVRYAKNQLSAYTQALGDIRTNTKSIDGKQSGDPEKSAEFIIEMVNDIKSPFRLPLTKGTIDTMKTKIAELQNCIAQTEDIAKNAEF